MNHKSTIKRGFTLVEIMVALSIFSIVALAVVNAFLVADRMNKKAQAMKTVIDNLHFALHGMAFSLKQGGNYHCFDGTLPAGGDTAPLKIMKECKDGDVAIAVTTPKSGSATQKVVAYRFNNTDHRIEYWEQGLDDWISLTVSSLTVNKMNFYVQNADGHLKMPFVFITFDGTAKAAQMTSELRLQTAISERL
jgi:prepilin-type N-terminal cleavage/methylation domain-containing protein